MKRNIFFVVVLTALLWGCQENDIMEFESDDSAVYFQGNGGSSMPGDGSVIYSWSYRYVDSTVVSFASRKADEKELVSYLTLKTMGKVKDYPRPVKIVIDEERTTAVRGVDFEVNLDTIAIPANAGQGRLPVTLLRTEALLTETKRVAFRLEENEHFKLHIREYKASSNWAVSADTLSALNYLVVFHEQYTMPGYWGYFGNDYWGIWTSKKYQLLNEVMDWSVDDWNHAGSYGPIMLGRFEYAAITFQRYLQAKADAGTPITEADGSYMQLPGKYAVDYSNYEN